MAEDPRVREIGRIADEQGREIVVGVDHDAVTLQTLHAGTSGPVTLESYRAEELGQLLIAACWQAGWQQAADGGGP